VGYLVDKNVVLVEIHTKIVFPDETFVDLLATPQKAHEYFFVQKCPDSVPEVEWKSHVLASKMVCYELCAIANDCTLLEYALNY
jgi:hypothetical protein